MNDKIMNMIPRKKMESRKFGLFPDRLVCGNQSMNKVCVCVCVLSLRESSLLLTHLYTCAGEGTLAVSH